MPLSLLPPVRHWPKGAKIFQEPRLLRISISMQTGRVQCRKEGGVPHKTLVEHGRRRISSGQGRSINSAFGYLANFHEVLESPQHQQAVFVEVDHPVVGKYKYCGSPFKMSKTPWGGYRSPLLWRTQP